MLKKDYFVDDLRDFCYLSEFAKNLQASLLESMYQNKSLTNFIAGI